MTQQKFKSHEDFDKWMLKGLEANGQNEAMLDGALCPDIYNTQETKVMFLYLETYGYGGWTESMSSKYSEWVGSKKTHTFRYCGVMASFLFEYLEILESSGTIPEFNKRDYQGRFKDFDLVTDSLSRTAFVNWRKSSGDKSKAAYSLIKAEAEKNKELLSEQFKFLNPDIIVLGSRESAKILFRQEARCKGLSYEDDQVMPVGNAIVAPLKHLSRAGYQYMYEQVNSILAQYLKP